GIPITGMAAPMIPALNDREMEAFLDATSGAGATGAGYVLLRLPLEIKDRIQVWLATTRPDAANPVMSLVRQTRGGKEFDAAWGKRQRGDGPYAQLIARRFRKSVERLGLNRDRKGMRYDLFERPLSTAEQGSLF